MFALEPRAAWRPLTVRKLEALPLWDVGIKLGRRHCVLSRGKCDTKIQPSPSPT